MVIYTYTFLKLNWNMSAGGFGSSTCDTQTQCNEFQNYFIS